MTRAEFLRVAGCGVSAGSWAGGRGAVAPGAEVIKVDPSAVVGELYNFWSTSVTTSQDYFADKSRHAGLRENHPFAKYINCVRFLGGIQGREEGFFRGASPDGRALVDFSDAIRNLRGIIECGYIPRIVLDNVPVSMSQPDELHVYGNTLPPKNPQLWHSYIRQLIQALVGEFGRDQINRWRFRVGTEPDLYPNHWSATEEEYYKHYDNTVAAVTSVLPDADIGPGNILNPSGTELKMKREKWALNIADHCGQTGTRMQFFAMSWYGRVGRPAELEKAVAKMRDRLSRYPRFSKTPVEIHEFSVLEDERQARLTGGDASEWSASWMASVADQVYKNGVAQVYQWDTTTGGIAHPRTHVLALLERMQAGKRLSVAANPAGEAGCLAGAKDGGIDLVIYRHRAEREDGPPARVRVEIPGRWGVARGNIIDRDHSGYIRALEKDLEEAGIKPLEKSPRGGRAPLMGVMVSERYGAEGQKYFNTHREKYRQIGRLSELAPLPQISNGALTLDLAGHSVVYLRLEQRA